MINYIPALFIIIFFAFFFLRSLLLKKHIGRILRDGNKPVKVSVQLSGSSMIIYLIYLLFPGADNICPVFFSSAMLFYAGSFLVVSGVLFGIVSSLSMGKSWRIGIDQSEKTELVISGVFRYSRNPYFLSLDIVLLGMMMSVMSPLVIFPASLSIILFHFIILGEERYLESVHKDSYRRYMGDTGRYF